MRNATSVHELNDDLPAFGMHGIGYLLPAPDLGGIEEAGNARVA